MGRKHTQREALEALPLPSEHLCVARAGGSRGQNLHDVTFSNGQTGLCTLPPRFRNVIWVKRGKLLVWPHLSVSLAFYANCRNR